MTPDVAGPSVILFISTVTNTSKGPVVDTGFVTIPIVPGLANGSVVNVVINYTALYKVETPINTTNPHSPNPQDPLKQAPMGCLMISRGEWECWYWQLNTVLLTWNNTPFPVAAEIIGPSEVNYVYESEFIVTIELTQSTYTEAGFDLSLAIPTGTGVNVEIPGAGFTIQFNQPYILLEYECVFIPLPASFCAYAGGPSMLSPYHITGPGAYGVAIVGYLEIANYTEYECIGPVGNPCMGTTKPVQWVLTTWFAAYNNTEANKLEAEPLNPTVMMNYIQSLLNNGAFNTITFPGNTLYLSINSVGEEVNTTPFIVLAADLGTMLEAMGVPIPNALTLYLNYLLVGISNIYSTASVTAGPNTGACAHNPIAYELEYQVNINSLNGHYLAPTLYADFNLSPCITKPTKQHKQFCLPLTRIFKELSPCE
ncbi:hypothetical protein [Vulcanisaeta thermophila]|uniref:hypothetical protein n=1 Tax=Vulcanisaeta thermophila TaxID=867917 RepID=UPI0008537F4F|nr:hypothetical protein [Vulcanisaeta thermophila]